MLRTIRTAQGPIKTRMILPGSKSITHRALLLAALANGVSEISGLFIDEECKAFIAALRQLGIVVQLDESSHSCIIAGGNGHFPKKQTTLWCANSKTAMQFLITACAASPGVYYFDGAPALRRLALSKLIHLLYRQGAQFIPPDIEHIPLTLIGTESLDGGDIIFDTPMNNQLISALLLIAPYTRSTLHLFVPELVNQQAIQMTCSMMAEFGVLVHRIHQGQFMVPVPQRYQARDYKIEPDFALAAYFFAAAAVTQGEMTIQMTSRATSKQSAVHFLTVLEKMGCLVHESRSGITLKGPLALQGIEVSMREISDCFLSLAAIAPFAMTPTRITLTGAPSQKESTRLVRLKNELIKMNISVEAGDRWIKIFPGNSQSAILNAHNDYRLAMAFAIMGLKIPDIRIQNSECVTSIYPDFFTCWNTLSEASTIKA